MAEGDDRAAVDLFRAANAHAKDRFPASHNNLGVLLARMGRLPEAEREFALALKQSDGKFDEAAYNLKLCRARLAAPATTTELAGLKLVETATGLNR